jgi:hypothetical protein
VGDLYWIGVFAGLGVSIGVLAGAIVSGSRAGLLAAIALGAVAGALLGFALAELSDAVAGGVGGIVGALGAGSLLRGALGRGGARIATGALLALAALILIVLAFVPALGYLIVIALPLLALRLRRTGGRRYAGLRTLAD